MTTKGSEKLYKAEWFSHIVNFMDLDETLMTKMINTFSYRVSWCQPHCAYSQYIQIQRYILFSEGFNLFISGFEWTIVLASGQLLSSCKINDRIIEKLTLKIPWYHVKRLIRPVGYE